MFVGTHTPRLDDKGRLTLPAKFRADLDGGVMLTKGQENCLAVYPRAEFDKMAARVSQASRADANMRILRRQLAASADFQVVDSQGRITIPASHRAYAGLDRDCAVTGAFEYFEIWDLAAWEGYESSTQETYSAAREETFGTIL